MATLYTAHYIYRAFAFPFLNPSMSPIHPLVALSAFAWQVTNGICIGGWLGGYGPTSVHDWAGHASFAIVGLIVWGWGFLGNMYHDDELREIRRKAMKKGEAEQKEKDATSAGKKGEKVDIKKFYDVPRAGLFRYVLYPHYLCEWIEWGGFWMLGGWSCMPARSFLLNEISTMLPRALSGKRWYIERFGEARVGKGKKAVIPGLL
jgi:3-oxo-5-alpha-steroid 4-dehydrogenase 1